MAIKYTFVGHGTHILDIGDKKVVVDPFFTSNPATDISADSVAADFILVSQKAYINLRGMKKAGPSMSPAFMISI